MAIMVHHLMRVKGWVSPSNCTLVLRLADRTDDRGGRHLGRSGSENPWRWPSSHHARSLAIVDHNTLLMYVLHMCLQVCLLFELLGADVATVLGIALAVYTHHVSA